MIKKLKALMLTQKMKQNTYNSVKSFLSKQLSPIQGIVSVALVGLFAFASVIPPMIASADQFQEQINALSAQNDQTRGNLFQLGAEAEGERPPP